MTEDEGDFEWVSEFIAGFLLCGVIFVFMLIAFFMFCVIGARLGFF